MSSRSNPLIKSNDVLEDEDDEYYGMFAMQLATCSIVPMVLRTAIEMNLLEIMAKEGKGTQLSASQIASHIPTAATNPHAPVIIDRMLRLLASYSILKCTLVSDEDGLPRRMYGLGPVCKYFTTDEDGVSIAPWLLAFQSKVSIDCWYHLKAAVLEGVSPFYKANAMEVFEFAKMDENVFNHAMYNHTTVTMKKVIEKYKGFEALNEIVDVGGGFGANLSLIVSKYPQIKGINFDLPHVIKEAPTCPGVEHIGGDMFQSVPKGEVIFMKWILHDWSDDKCLKILKNCFGALPENGKVIVVESVVPEFPEMDIASRNVFKFDVNMFVACNQGKERTEKEFEALARGAGFSHMKLICRAFNFWVIEFYKKSVPDI